MNSAPRYCVSGSLAIFRPRSSVARASPNLPGEMKNVSESNVGQRVVLVVAQRLPVVLLGLVKQHQPLPVGAFSY